MSGLKFSTALPPDLARFTMAARLSDPASAGLVAEKRVFTRSAE